jgi:hypothetical protein
MPRVVRGWQRQSDGSMKRIRFTMPTQAEEYSGKHELAIIDALNILGMWHSPLSHMPKGKEHQECRESIMGEDYEWGEALTILYGALGIDLDLRHPEPAYERFRKIWEERNDDSQP